MYVSASQLGLSRVQERVFACVCVCMYLCGVVGGAREGVGEEPGWCVLILQVVMDGNCCSKLWKKTLVVVARRVITGATVLNYVSDNYYDDFW